MLEIMTASAGSGKTYNLALKYIRLLIGSSDKYAYRHILAVTFTNKATDEMKGRILKELHILSSDTASSAYLRDLVPDLCPDLESLREKASTVLKNILHDYSAFSVSTIDKFFQQALRAFSREIGQFASYQVELDKVSLVKESVERMLDSLTEADQNLLGWLTRNVMEKIERGERYRLEDDLYKMAVRLQSAQRLDALRELHCAKGDDERVDSHDNELTKLKEVCRKIRKDFSDKVQSKAKEILSVLSSCGISPEDFNRKFMKSVVLYAELDEKIFDGVRIYAPTDSFIANASDSQKWFPKSRNNLLNTVQELLEVPLGEFVSLFSAPFKEYNTAILIEKQIYGLGLASVLEKNLKDIMKERNVLCIDDSNTLLRDIIDGSDAPFVYEKLGVKYENFLLDEFQDTALVQWENFLPLLKESDACGGRNLIVGDVKQSIYRWRGSDWNLLQSVIPEQFPDRITMPLDTNWRSLANIVTFNNDFFCCASQLLDNPDSPYKGLLEGIYKDTRQKVAPSKAELSCGGMVKLSFCDKSMELDMVLESVRAAFAKGALASEIAVLVRSGGEGSQVADHLTANGYSVMTDDSLKVKKSLTVRRIVSLMSYADNPEDTVGSYLARSLGVELPDRYNSLSDLVEALLRSLKDSDSNRLWEGEIPHIQSFLDYVQDYGKNNGNDLRSFLKDWDDADPSIASPSDADSIRIMTIHKSKGLDFQYVILPFAESIKIFRHEEKWCIPDLSGTSLEGVAEGVYDVDLSASTIDTCFSETYLKEAFLQLVDNLNVLYVAMTRPVLGLHIIAATPPAKLRNAIPDGPMSYSDLSHVLYRFVRMEYEKKVTYESDGVCEHFTFGDILDFSSVRKKSEKTNIFPANRYDALPSFALNPVVSSCDGIPGDGGTLGDGIPGDGDIPGDGATTVIERGRLRFDKDTIAFFSPDTEEDNDSIKARNKGIILHDILSKVVVPSDLEAAVEDSLRNGLISRSEADDIRELLTKRIKETESMGWFDPEAKVLNEAELCDTDSRTYRPDRVVIKGGSISIIDFKFGKRRKEYARQVTRYANLWRKMGYSDIQTYLWYVEEGHIEQI